MEAKAVAQDLVAERFPDCIAAILGGSLVRGDATSSSDLDLVIVSDDITPYRESLRYQGWPVEVFVHSQPSLREFFERDARRRRPSLPRMCAEGIVVRETAGLGRRIQDEAAELLAAGPNSLTPDEVAGFRYGLTDLLDDLLGSQCYAETIFIANDLAVMAADLILIDNGHWIGRGKWVVRALERLDPAIAAELVKALTALYTGNEKRLLTRFAESALDPIGGRLFEGYSARPPQKEA